MKNKCRKHRYAAYYPRNFGNEFRAYVVPGDWKLRTQYGARDSLIRDTRAEWLARIRYYRSPGSGYSSFIVYRCPVCGYAPPEVEEFAEDPLDPRSLWGTPRDVALEDLRRMFAGEER